VRLGSLWVVGLAGCDALFSITTLPATDAAPHATCALQLYPMDTFTSAAPPCQPWGTVSNAVGPSMKTGHGLAVTLDQPGYGACYMPGTILDATAGLFLEVDDPVGGNGLYTALHTYALDAKDVSASFVALADGLYLYQAASPSDLLIGMARFSPMTRWWRLRPTPDGIAGETSANGLDWSTLGVAKGTVGQVAFDFGAGLDTGPAPAPAPTVTFRNLNSCPP
jgi:hypothetical protein